MKKSWIVLLLVVLLVLPLPCLAAGTVDPVVDNAGLFSSDELTKLNQMAADISDVYGIPVCIVTESSLHGESPMDYAESLYASGNRRWWDGEDMILFLIDMGERDWFISTGGEAIYIFTDYGLDRLGEVVVPYLSQGQYYAGFYSYLQELPGYFDAYLSGNPVDGYLDPNDGDYSVPQEQVVYYETGPKVNWFLSVMIGAVIAGIAIFIMRGSMNTKKNQRSAADYVVSGSYRLHTQKDVFLFSQVSKVRREEPKSSSGGGSSVHRSSGGSHHGGRGGKF